MSLKPSAFFPCHFPGTLPAVLKSWHLVWTQITRNRTATSGFNKNHFSLSKTTKPHMSSPIFLFPLVKSASFRNNHVQFLFQVVKQVICKQVSSKLICSSHCPSTGHSQSRDPVSKPVAGRGPAEAEHVTGIKHHWEGKRRISSYHWHDKSSAELWSTRSSSPFQPPQKA